MQSIDLYWNNRRWLALARLAATNYLFRFHFGFRPEFQPLRPGYEMKLACEAAEKVGAKLDFLGAEMCQGTWQALVHETRLNVPEYFIKRFQYL